MELCRLIWALFLSRSNGVYSTFASCAFMISNVTKTKSHELILMALVVNHKLSALCLMKS
jgi:hypothetical protein